MKKVNQHLANSLSTMLAGSVCIVGVGNRQRGDDGAGPRVIDARGPGVPGAWLDAGVAPENFLEPIVRTRPNAVLIVDAVAFGGCPGEPRLMNASAIAAFGVSTHAGSLGMLSEYLKARAKALVLVLAIQPESIDARDELSQPVEASVLELAEMLSSVLTSASQSTSPY